MFYILEKVLDEKSHCKVTSYLVNKQVQSYVFVFENQ